MSYGGTDPDPFSISDRPGMDLSEQWYTRLLTFSASPGYNEPADR